MVQSLCLYIVNKQRHDEHHFDDRISYDSNLITNMLGFRNATIRRGLFGYCFDPIIVESLFPAILMCASVCYEARALIFERVFLHNSLCTITRAILCYLWDTRSFNNIVIRHLWFAWLWLARLYIRIDAITDGSVKRWSKHTRNLL